MVLDPHWAGNCLYSVGDPSFQTPGESHNQGLASKTRLNGVSVAQRKRVNTPLVTTTVRKRHIIEGGQSRDARNQAHRYNLSGFALWRTNAWEESRLHFSRRAHVGAGHWRKRGNLQRRERGIAAVAS